MLTSSAKRARKGRARAIVPREPNGQRQRSVKSERDAALSVVLGARLRHGHAHTLEDARDPRIATALGRAFRAGSISKREYDAGELYAAAFRSAAGLLGIPAPYPRCPDAARASGPEIDESTAAKIKRDFWDANAALGNAGRAAWREVREVAVMDNDCDSPATLQFGLRALAVHYRLPVDEKEKAA